MQIHIYLLCENHIYAPTTLKIPELGTKIMFFSILPVFREWSVCCISPSLLVYAECQSFECLRYSLGWYLPLPMKGKMIAKWCGTKSSVGLSVGTLKQNKSCSSLSADLNAFWEITFLYYKDLESDVNQDADSLQRGKNTIKSSNKLERKQDIINAS